MEQDTSFYKNSIVKVPNFGAVRNLFQTLSSGNSKQYNKE